MEQEILRLPNVTELLKFYAALREAYSRFCAQALTSDSFSPNEINVLIFLSNNPQINTARELTITLGVSKGLIARSVDSLTSRGYLTTWTDQKDRRVVHLMITDKAVSVMEQIRSGRAEFSRQVLQGIAPDSLRTYFEVASQIHENVLTLIQKEGGRE